MLRDIKKQSSGLGAKIVMGLLIIAFAFWGVSGSLLTATNDSAATVNGEKISITEFNQANQAQRNRLQSQFGDNIGAEYFDSESFKRGVLSQLIDAELLRQQAEKFDYDVPPDVIRSYIESSPGLQIDGKFNKEAYATYLAQVNKSAELLQRDIKRDIKRSALPKMLNDSAFTVESEIKNQYKLSKQKRNFDYFEISSKDYEDKVTVTEEDIADHYNEFGQDYMTIEEVSVNYIELSSADIMQNIEITDEELATYYDQKKESLRTAEKRRVQHILLPVDGDQETAKAAIEKIAERIANGEDFSAVAKETSKDPGSSESGGDLGLVSQGDMVEAFDEKLFSMSEGEVSEPVLSTFGYHIIKLNEIKFPEMQTLEESRETLIAELKLEKAEEAFLTQADDLSTTIIDADNVLELAAETSGLPLQTTEFFARGRGTGVAANENFSSEAFSDVIKVEGEISEMINLGDNHIAYIQLVKHNPPVIKPIEEVSDAINNKLKSEKSLELTKQEVMDYVDKINAQEITMTDLATELDKTVVEAIDVERVGSKQPFNLVNNVFTLKLDTENNQIVYVDSSNNNFAIVKLKSIENADVSGLSEDEMNNIASQIERSATNNEVLNITAELRNDASISINEKIFEVIQQ